MKFATKVETMVVHVTENEASLKFGTYGLPHHSECHKFSLVSNCSALSPVVGRRRGWQKLRLREAMGIKQLGKFLKSSCASAMSHHSCASEYKEAVVAIDVSPCLYQCMTAMGDTPPGVQPGSELDTSHIVGLFRRSVRLLELGIKPIFVFDGEAPEMKSHVLQQRAKNRARSKELLEEAQAVGDEDAMKRYGARTRGVLALFSIILLLGFLLLESQMIDSPRRVDFDAMLSELNSLKQNAARRGIIGVSDSGEMYKALLPVTGRDLKTCRVFRFIHVAKNGGVPEESLLGVSPIKRVHQNPASWLARLVKATQRHNDEAMELLRTMGLPVLQAPGEAERLCAQLALSGHAKAAATEAEGTLANGRLQQALMPLPAELGVINNDPDTGKLLKVAFVPNYCVSAAQVMIPASDISEHISTAGTEASGTSNMKFVMNGGLIVGTMDGANIEIREECGEDTMFIFGCLEHEVSQIASKAKSGHYPIDQRLQNVFQAIRNGDFSQGEPEAHGEFCSLVDRLCNIQAAGTWEGDKYLVINDFPSFVDAQNRVDQTYADKAKWCKLSIQAASSMAKFSTDRTIKEYADVIWGVKPAPRPLEK
eukprot:s899_g17.t2